MKNSELKVFSAFLSHQQTLIRKMIEEISATTPKSRESLSHLGYLLHNLYNALEDLFQEVARTVENRVEDPGRFHRELLKRMALEIHGVRPALLSEPVFRLLNELRGFRHVFRHAYEYELDPEKLAALKHRLVSHWSLLIEDLERFQVFLHSQF